MRSIFLDIIMLIFWGPVRKIIYKTNPAYTSRIAEVIAFFAYHFLGRRRKVIAEELKKSIGKEWTSAKIHRKVIDSFKVSVRSQLMMFHLPKLTSANIAENISIEGLELLKEALALKKGVIVLNPHFGPFMMIMPALHYRGFKVNQIALQGEPPWEKRKGLNKKGYDIRYATIEGNIPVNFINASLGPYPLRAAINALKNNEILLFPSTGRGGNAMHQVNLMKRKVELDAFPFKLALRTGAVLLPAFVLCEGSMGRIIIEKPLNIQKEITPELLLERYARILDSYINEKPDHFVPYLYLVQKTSRFGERPFFIN